MKILHIIPSIAPVRGGPSQALIEMVKALIAAGISVEIATTNDNGRDLLEVKLEELIEYQQVPVRFFARFSPSQSAVREFAFSAAFTTWLWQNIHKYDLIHVHAIFSYASTMAMAIARWHKVPYILLPHGLLCTWSLQQNQQKKQIYLKLIERANLNHASAIHFTAAAERQEALAVGITAANFVLPLGLNLSPEIANAKVRLRQQLQLPQAQPILLFLSRLHPKKGLDFLIPALAKLTKYPFTLAIAGSGEPEYEAELKQLVETNGISDRTKFVGFIEGEPKNLFLQGADLFVLTSKSENFGVVVLEAMAAGIPVLLTPGVALAEVVKEHQVGFVPELEIEAIATQIEYFFTHPQIGKQMGDRGKALVKSEYSWQKIANQLSEIYKSCQSR